MNASALPFALGAAASAATLFGGTITLRLRGRLNLVLGLSAGIVLGVALFDLLPEALHIATAEGARYVLSAVAVGFAAYLIADRLLATLSVRGERFRQQIGPASLTLHSLLDGVGIGLAFQLSPEVGWGVAIAVLSHDIADGVNIVGLSLAVRDRRSAHRWLALNGAAPLAGVALGQVFAVPPSVLVPMLGVLAGTFLYIGASELLPRSYRMDGRFATTCASLSGFVIAYVVTRYQG